MEHYDGPEQVNVGTGTDVTIREIAETIADVVGFDGETEWDTTKPDGTPQKLLDVSKLAEAGWTSKISPRRRARPHGRLVPRARRRAAGVAPRASALATMYAHADRATSRSRICPPFGGQRVIVHG